MAAAPEYLDSLRKNIFPPTLLETPGFKKDEIEATLKLDQNESPHDWPEDIKAKILNELKRVDWNRYPEPYPARLIKTLSKYTGVQPDQLIVGPGSNYILTVLINATCRQASQVVVARPSFPLYEAHLRYENIPYEPWCLDKNLEYNLELLPKLQKNSVILFASPNNPVGNVLEHETLEHLLSQNPHSLIVADEAYLEYGNTTYANFLESYPNLIIVRTFSKTFGAAAIRLGYAIGHKSLMMEIKKLVLPFLVNPFTEIAISTVLESEKFVGQIIENAKEVVNLREDLYDHLVDIGKQLGFTLKPSFSNFFLLQCNSQERCDKLYRALLRQKILVRNVSKGPALEGCLRLSVGTQEENLQVVKYMKSLGF